MSPPEPVASLAPIPEMGFVMRRHANVWAVGLRPAALPLRRRVFLAPALPPGAFAAGFAALLFVVVSFAAGFALPLAAAGAAAGCFDDGASSHGRIC